MKSRRTSKLSNVSEIHAICDEPIEKKKKDSKLESVLEEEIKRDFEKKLVADNLIISDYMQQNSICQPERNSRKSTARREFRVANYIENNEI